VDPSIVANMVYQNYQDGIPNPNFGLRSLIGMPSVR